MTTPSGTTAHRVREVVAPVVAQAGLVLEDVVLAPAGRRTVVRIVLDLGDDELGSLDLDTVGEVARAISDALDAADPVHGAYVLEVSSPGTDRPLTEPRHFRRARTRMVRLVLRDGSVRTGRMTDAGQDEVELLVAPGVNERIAMADIARGVVEVELAHIDDEEVDA